MTSRRPARGSGGLAAVLLAGSVALGGCGSPNSDAAVVSTPTNTSGYAGTLLDRPYAKPTGDFTDTSGRRFDWTATKPVTVVFFGYTTCPDECPTAMADVAAALRRSPADVRERVDVVFVTTDPERDAAPVIRRWLDRFDPRFIGLTASAASIGAAARQLAVPLVSPTEHGTQLIGFRGAEGLLVWTEGTSVGDLRTDLARLAR